MLGTNRSSVSLAAGVLKRKKIIEYGRGSVTILNRKKLEEYAVSAIALCKSTAVTSV
jgi:hypothetical protein